MARTRSAATSKTKKETSSSSDGTLTCPECGRDFARPASLGAHRNRAHGVVGASRRRAGRRSSSRNGGTTGRAPATQATRQQSTRTRNRASSSAGGARSDGARSRIDRDALLQTLFPNGVPAREEVIRRANAWLDEAEQLASAK